MGRIELSHLVAQLGKARRQIGAHLFCNFVEILGEARVLLKEHEFRLLDHAGDQRVEYGRRLGRGDEFLGGRYSRNGSLLTVRGRAKRDQRDGDRSQAAGTFSGLNDAHLHNSVFIREITAAR